MNFTNGQAPIILAIEADYQVRMALERVLGDVYSVVSAPTAGEAAGLIALGLNPDVILTEHMLAWLPIRLQGRVVQFDKPGNIQQIESDLAAMIRFMRGQKSQPVALVA